MLAATSARPAIQPATPGERAAEHERDPRREEQRAAGGAGRAEGSGRSTAAPLLEPEQRQADAEERRAPLPEQRRRRCRRPPPQRLGDVGGLLARGRERVVELRRRRRRSSPVEALRAAARATARATACSAYWSGGQLVAALVQSLRVGGRAVEGEQRRPELAAQPIERVLGARGATRSGDRSHGRESTPRCKPGSSRRSRRALRLDSGRDESRTAHRARRRRRAVAPASLPGQPRARGTPRGRGGNARRPRGSFSPPSRSTSSCSTSTSARTTGSTCSTTSRGSICRCAS